MAHTITVNNETFILSGTFIGKAINEDWNENSLRNKFKVKIQNKSTKKYFYITFWDSIVNCKKGKDKVSKDILKDAFESMLYDAQAFAQNSRKHEFNATFGYDTFDSKVYNACKKTYENFERICEDMNGKRGFNKIMDDFNAKR